MYTVKNESFRVVCCLMKGKIPLLSFSRSFWEVHRRLCSSWQRRARSRGFGCLGRGAEQATGSCAKQAGSRSGRGADCRAGEHHHHDAWSGGAELQLASDAAEAAAGGQWRVRRRRRRGRSRSRSRSWWWCWWPRRKAANATASAAASCAGAKEEMPIVRPVSK